MYYEDTGLTDYEIYELSLKDVLNVISNNHFKNIVHGRET